MCVLLVSAVAVFVVWSSAFFESDIIMHGCPGGISSCAMVMACNSAVFMHVSVVPKDCGIPCILVRIGIVFWFCHRPLFR